MKKITLLLVLFFVSSWSFAQTCEQTFSEFGTDSDAVLTIQSTALTCSAGTINSITISSTDLGFYCGEYYSFTIDIDGVVTTGVCSEDLDGMVITDFSELTITAQDNDDDEDFVYMDVTIAVNYTLTAVPNCDALLTSPVDGSLENNLLGKLTWDAATGGAAGYILSVGTTSGGTDIVNMLDVLNVTTYDIPGLLAQGQEYFVKITPYNALGNATDCSEYSFETTTYEPGNLCENAIAITTLPYTTTDNTENYADVYYEGTPGASGCGSTSSYLNGNDVVYSYTATADASIKIVLTPEEGNTYSGFFIYNSCANIGVQCNGGVANAGVLPREISEFPVQSGQTYYFVISTWASPQTVSYQLDITENTCTSATAAYSIISDCADGNEQFSVQVNITDLGTATSLSVSDDTGNPSQALTQVGTLTFGPYDNGTPVIITVANDQDSECQISSAILTQNACPPSNDECANAQEVTVNTDYDCATVTAGTITGATASTVTGNTCSGTPDDDVWYSFTATNPVQQIKLLNIAGSTTDLYHSLWTGTCGALTLVPDSCSDNETSTPENLVVGQIYFVRVYTYTSTAGQATTFDICIGTPPPPPANDNCAGAIAIAVDEQFCSGSNTNGNNTGATGSGVAQAECFGSGGTNDVWFSFVVPVNTASVDISTEFLGGTLLDTQIALYDGTCGNLVEQDCAQDGTVELENGFSWNSTISDAAVTVGQTYFVRVSSYSNTQSGSFCLDISTNETLANTDFDKKNFTVYPNPVKDVLNVSYVENISTVAVYNMLGQEVALKTMNANEGQIDMSALASGTYLVKVKTDATVQTIKVVKQ